MKKNYIRKILSRFIRFKWSIIIPTKIYLKILYYIEVKKCLHLENPKTFNEKLQWLKINDFKFYYTDMVDKYKAKKIVIDLIGPKHVIPTIGIYTNTKDIDFLKLPNKFVIKTTHGSGEVFIVKDKNNVNFNKIIKRINRSLKSNYYYMWREKPYKYVEPKIIIEPLFVDESKKELKDYKFFCFNGEPKFLFVASDRNKPDQEVKFDFVDINFNKIEVKNGHPNSNIVIEKPLNFDVMLDISRKLSKGFKHIRIDLYNVNGDIYFGEYTFYHFSGMVPFIPEEFDYEFGKYIEIRRGLSDHEN